MPTTEKKMIKDQIIEAVSSMSVMDIVELIAEMEKKFNVSTSNFTNTTVNIPATTDSPEEKTEFDIILKSIGINKIAIIKVVRSMTGLGLKEAKDLVESAPVTLKENINKNDAESLKKSLEEAGAQVEIK